MIRLFEKYKTNTGFEEALARLDGAEAIELFPGSIEAYQDSKGGQRFKVIDTGTPKKFVSGNLELATGGLADAIYFREGRLYKVMGKFAIPMGFKPVVNNTLLRAYDLGAHALVDYAIHGNYNYGTPVKPFED